MNRVSFSHWQYICISLLINFSAGGFTVQNYRYHKGGCIVWEQVCVHLMERWERAREISVWATMTSASNAAAFFNPTVFMGPLSNPIIGVGILQCNSVGRRLDPRH